MADRLDRAANWATISQAIPWSWLLAAGLLLWAAAVGLLKWLVGGNTLAIVALAAFTILCVAGAVRLVAGLFMAGPRDTSVASPTTPAAPSLDMLLVLCGVGTHFLQNRPISTDAQLARLEVDVNTWQGYVVEAYRKAGATANEIDDLVTLRGINLINIADPYRRSADPQAHIQVASGVYTKVDRIKSFIGRRDQPRA